MLSFQFNRSTIAAIALLALPVAAAAQTPEHPADNSAQFPSTHDLKMLTTSGSYLAARHASVERDAASAATFYRSALRTDPKNNELLDRAFISSLADGDIDEAVFAERLVVLRNLVALGGIGIEIVFARETGNRIDSTVQRDGGFEGEFDGFVAEDRQRAG